MTPARPPGRLLQSALFILGGPVLSAIAACVSFGKLWSVLSGELESPTWRLSFWLALSAAANSLCLLSLVPIHAGGLDSDGLLLTKLFTFGKRNRLYQNLTDALATGTRPRDWDPRLVAQ